MKKSEQIKALQAECDRLAKERDAYRQSLVKAHVQVGDLKTEAFAVHCELLREEDR